MLIPIVRVLGSQRPRRVVLSSSANCGGCSRPPRHSSLIRLKWKFNERSQRRCTDSGIAFIAYRKRKPAGAKSRRNRTVAMATRPIRTLVGIVSPHSPAVRKPAKTSARPG